jgi:hypothetical protein
VTFASASFARGLLFDGSAFGQAPNFRSMKVGGDAVFIAAVFKGPVYFAGADIANNFVAYGARFQNVASFTRMKVGGSASFNATFQKLVDLRYADFDWLDLSHASWPKAAAQLHMQGMSYKYIRAAPEEPESHKVLLMLADQSAYTPDVYSILEEFFLRQGYRDDAYLAFTAGKRRERQYLHGLGWLGSWVLEMLPDYGRQTYRLGVICIFLVALGCVLFSPKKMEPQNPDDTPPGLQSLLV